MPISSEANLKLKEENECIEEIRSSFPSVYLVQVIANRPGGALEIDLMQQILLLRVAPGLGTACAGTVPAVRWHGRTAGQQGATAQEREGLRLPPQVAQPGQSMSTWKGLVSCWKLDTCPCTGQACLQ